MAIPSDTYFETLVLAIRAGTITAEEIQRIPLSSVTAPERQALLIFLANLNAPNYGGTWGGATTLPTPQAIVFKNFASDGVGTVDVVIPPSLWWKAEMKLGGGVTSAGGNTVDEFEPTGAEPRADGQAHPAVTLTIPNAPVDTVVLRVNYEPIA